MLLRLVALGAVGYAAYKYLGSETAQAGRPASGAEREKERNDASAPSLELAGGPLSDEAKLIHREDGAPAG